MWPSFSVCLPGQSQGKYERIGRSTAAIASADYFTSFEDHGVKYFLAYIPWIYNRSIVRAAPVRQASDIALSGTYSCYFYEEILGTSSLNNEQNLPIPSQTAAATLGGWIYVGLSNVKIDVHIVIDGVDHTTTWSFDRPFTAGWVYRSYTVPLTSGAQTFYGWILLKPASDLSNNHFWLDDYFVEFFIPYWRLHCRRS